ncbi:GntR family transcriptional regulator [Sporomusa sp.]|uniref:GntR family transcriptional regulator n=1 Tax=Sporomusa sp. TaxID=2078658 RepID=UPI002C47A733|nr:GntR family transcriptional regulator [Sporomusa sp.]HWR43943.1 GntR family transcriptional regulator [Sporomusa sp.]
MIVQKLGVPIYLQVKALILDKIKTGYYKHGDKLPTERQLSEQLGISRNTVSAAYKELLLEGVLEAQQGRGTFVREQTTDPMAAGADVAGSRLERALKVIDAAMVQVVEFGFTVEQFATIVAIRAKEKTFDVRELRVAIVDCTLEYVERFIAQLGQVTQVHFESITLAELMAGTVKPEFLAACDLVVTTMEHQSDVAEILGNSTKLMAVATTPNLEAVIKLARLPAGTEVAVVAKTQEFVNALNRLLTKIGCNGIKLIPCVGNDREQVKQCIAKHNVIVTAEAVQQTVRQAADETQDIITFYYEIDQGSLQQVVSRLVAESDKAKE